MKFVLIGSVGQVTNKLLKKFVKEGIKPIVITRSETNAQIIKQMGGIPAIGNINDLDFLIRVFKNADSVFLLSAINHFSKYYKNEMNNQINNMIEAIIQSNVQNIVYLSCIGAHKPGIGLIDFHYKNEQLLLKKLNDRKHLSLVRASKFYDNFSVNLPNIKYENKIYSFFDTAKQHSLVDLNKISDLVYNLMVYSPNEKIHIEYAETERITAAEIVKILSINLKTLQLIEWVKISNEKAINSLIDLGMDDLISIELVEALSAERHDDVHEDIFSCHIPSKGYSFAEFVRSTLKPNYDSLNDISNNQSPQ